MIINCFYNYLLFVICKYFFFIFHYSVLEFVYILTYIFLFLENSTFNLESYEVTVPKCNAKNITPPVIHENHRVSNHELKLNHLNQNNLHFPSITNYKIKLLSITLLYVLLSQIVLMLLYYDLGFLFGNVSKYIIVLYLFKIFKYT